MDHFWLQKRIKNVCDPRRLDWQNSTQQVAAALIKPREVAAVMFHSSFFFFFFLEKAQSCVDTKIHIEAHSGPQQHYHHHHHHHTNLQYQQSLASESGILYRFVVTSCKKFSKEPPLLSVCQEKLISPAFSGVNLVSPPQPDNFISKPFFKHILSLLSITFFLA